MKVVLVGLKLIKNLVARLGIYNSKRYLQVVLLD